MEQNKLEKLKKIVSNVKEEEVQSEYEIIVLLFKSFFLIKKDVNSPQELWFEKKEIKEDKEYYQTVSLIFNSFIEYCDNKTSFQAKVFSNDVNNIIKKSKFSVTYDCLIKLSNIFELGEESYTELISALYSLGYKKESPSNIYLIETLKDFIEDKKIKDSQYYSQIKLLNFEIISESFIKNITELFSLVVSKESEEKINSQMAILKRNGYYNEQRESTLSTNIDNIDNEDTISNGESLKYENQLISSTKMAVGPESAETNKNNNQPSNFEEENINDSGNVHKEETKKIKEEKVKNEEKSIKGDTSNNQIITITGCEDNNEEQKKGKRSINDIFTMFKNVLNNKEDSKEEKKDKIKSEDDIKDYVLSIIQRNNRYNEIIQEISKLINNVKKFESVQTFQRMICEDKIEIEKLLISINGMKSIIEMLKPPTIINIKRKILDLVVFSLIKRNKDKFILAENYSPNQSFLNLIKNKLEEYSKKKGLSVDNKKKIEEKKKFIQELITKNQTKTSFPLDCTDVELDDIMSFLGFCKTKYNNIVHISKEALKYYYIPFKDKISPEFSDLFYIFQYYNKNEEDDNNNKLESNGKKKKGEKEEEYKSIYGKTLEIEIGAAIDFILSDEFDTDKIASEFEKKLEEIDKKKKLYISKYNDSLMSGTKKIFNSCNKLIVQNNLENELDQFQENEKRLICEELERFKKLLTAMKEKLLLLEVSIDGQLAENLIDEFFTEFDNIINLELQFDNKYYRRLCEREKDRFLLPFFECILMKYQAMNLYCKEFFNILNEYYENNKNNIMAILNEIKDSTGNLIGKIKKVVKVESSRKLFIEWRSRHFSRPIIEFDKFVEKTKKWASSINFKLNEDLISDKVTSFWLIDNDLDEYLEY